MRAYRLNPGSRGLIMLPFSLVALAGCAADGDARKNPLMPPLDHPATIARLQAAQSPATVTAVEFNRRNPYGWVGRVHNRFLKEFFREINARPTADLCAAIKRVALEGRYLGKDADKLPRRERESLYGRATRGTRCANRVATTQATPRIVQASLGRPGSALPMRDDPSSYLDAIGAAMDNSATVGALATAVSAIVSSAEANISGDALAGVYAVADVAVSSTDYWDSNASSELGAFSASYRDCIENSSILEACVYATQFKRSTPAPGPLRMVNASYAPSSRRACTISGREIAKADYYGAMIGFWATFTPQGTVLGAVGGSGADATWQFGRFLWCAYHQ